MHVAAEKGHAEVAKYLIRAGCDVDKAEINGVTPLFIASEKGHAEVVEALIKARCDVDMRLDFGV